MTDRETKPANVQRTPEQIARRLPRRPGDEIARLGQEIYRRDIRDKVLGDHDGAIISIDVDSGQWAIGQDIRESNANLRAKCPDATDIWGERVGYVAMGSLGGGAPKRDQ